MQSGGRYLAVAPLSSPASAPPLSSPTGASEASDESSRAATPNVDPAAAAVGAAPAATTQTKGAATHARTASSATKHVIQIPPSRAHLLAQQQAAAAAAALAGQSSLAAPVRSSQRRNKLHGSTRRFDQDYVLLPEYLLGSGASGTVYVCTSRRHPTHEYAVKVIKTDQVQLDTDKMREEMQILATIRHRNIIRLKDVYQTDDTIHIVTELAFGGELFDRILKVRSFSESDVVNLTRKLFGAVAYLHGRGIIHRDLKPENLLFSTNDKDSDIKISDFGFARDLLKPSRKLRARTQVGCLRADQLVLAADGVTTLRADQVRTNMKLAGEFEPVTVTQAFDTVEEMPTANQLYRITHDDGTSYVVTGDDDAMHLVTVRFDQTMKVATRDNGHAKSIFVQGVFDPKAGEITEALSRTYRARNENPDASHDIPEVDTTLVRDTIEECFAALEVLMEETILAEPDSVLARAPTLGTLVDLPVAMLAGHPEWWDPLCVASHGPPYFRAVRQAHVNAAVKAPAEGFVVPDTFPETVERVVKIGCSLEDAEGQRLRHWDGEVLTPVRNYTLLVLRDASGNISYRDLSPGDVVRVVVCLHNSLRGSRCTPDNPDGSRSDTFKNLETLLKSTGIPLNEEGGLVITEINPIPGAPLEIDSTQHQFDQMIEANMLMILQELGARKIISCGAYANYRWRDFVKDVPGVIGVAHTGNMTTFTYTQPMAARESVEVNVFHSPHPCIEYHLAAVEEAIQLCYDIAPRSLPKIVSIKLEEGSAKYAPFAVDGNHRYRLGSGLLTHNSYGYMAPEIFSGKPYDEKSDVWSLGIVVYIMLCGLPPYVTVADTQGRVEPFWLYTNAMVSASTRPVEFPDELGWKSVSAQAKHFLASVLALDPAKRMRSVDTLNHPWLKPRHRQNATPSAASSAAAASGPSRQNIHSTHQQLNRYLTFTLNKRFDLNRLRADLAATDGEGVPDTAQTTEMDDDNSDQGQRAYSDAPASPSAVGDPRSPQTAFSHSVTPVLTNVRLLQLARSASHDPAAPLTRQSSCHDSPSTSRTMFPSDALYTPVSRQGWFSAGAAYDDDALGGAGSPLSPNLHTITPATAPTISPPMMTNTLDAYEVPPAALSPPALHVRDPSASASTEDGEADPSQSSSTSNSAAHSRASSTASSASFLARRTGRVQHYATLPAQYTGDLEEEEDEDADADPPEFHTSEDEEDANQPTLTIVTTDTTSAAATNPAPSNT